jgi:hypothetical protein
MANDDLGLGQIGTRYSKTVVGSIAATTKSLIQDMDHDQYRPATPFKNKLVLIQWILQSL